MHDGLAKSMRPGSWNRGSRVLCERIRPQLATGQKKAITLGLAWVDHHDTIHQVGGRYLTRFVYCCQAELWVGLKILRSTNVHSMSTYGHHINLEPAYFSPVIVHLRGRVHQLLFLQFLLVPYMWHDAGQYLPDCPSQQPPKTYIIGLISHEHILLAFIIIICT